MRRRRGFFKQAIDLDPTFAGGHSALALYQLQAVRLNFYHFMLRLCGRGRPLVSILNGVAST
jgi:hypothetical protein